MAWKPHSAPFYSEPLPHPHANVALNVTACCGSPTASQRHHSLACHRRRYSRGDRSPGVRRCVRMPQWCRSSIAPHHAAIVRHGGPYLPEISNERCQCRACTHMHAYGQFNHAPCSSKQATATAAAATAATSVWHRGHQPCVASIAAGATLDLASILEFWQCCWCCRCRCRSLNLHLACTRTRVTIEDEASWRQNTWWR